MKKNLLYLLIVLSSFTMVGCSSDTKSVKTISGEKPPEVQINIGNKNYEAKLGTYCWNSGCVDTVGPVEFLQGEEPIKVSPAEKISFLMNYEPKPNHFYLMQIQEGNEKEVLIEDNSFLAPAENGVYYYSYGVWWMDDKEENVSHGDAFYSFVIEVSN
jgi:hypothetical protein